MKPKAIGYARVSTSRQANEGVSLDVQREKITAYCTYKGFALVDFCHEGVSGSGDVRRVEFEKVINNIENGTVNAIIIYSLSRFTRSTRELLEFVEKYVLTGKVELHSVVENLDTSSPTGRFMLKVMGAMNELEREQIIERTQAALDHKRSKGEKLGGYVPYGFDVNIFGVLNINNTEQDTINLMRSMYNSNYSFNSIATELNNQGIPSKQGKSWDHKTVSRILRRV